LGVLRVLAYEDTNDNGMRDAGEPLVAGMDIKVRDATGAPVEVQATQSAGEPVAEAEVPAGDYRVESIPPPGYVSSSPAEVTVTVSPGETAEVRLGLRFAPTATPEPTAIPSATREPAATAAPQPTPTPTPAASKGLGNYAGLLVAAVAVVLVVLMRALRARR